MSDNFKNLSRRDFLKGMAYGAAALSSLQLSSCSYEVKPSRSGAKGIFVQEGKPLLIAVEGDNPQKMLEKAIDAIGGLNPLFGKGKRALLKGNFVFAQPFPITTDPQIALLFGRHLKDSGFEQVNVFDAPGTYLNDSKEKTLDMHGLMEQKNPYGIGFYAGDAGERSEFIMTQNQQWQAYPEIGVHNDIYTTPVIINMPCLKRHHTSYLTCALKNNFGAIYGPQRWDAHFRGEGIKKMARLKAENRQADKFKNIYHFMDAIAEFADAVRPELTFVDARSILTKGGPTAGIGKIKTGVNLFILSQDMVAVDAYCSKLMEKHDDSYSTEMILPYLKTAEKLGLGTMDLSKVEVTELSI
ncbi:MAG: hypothetical protein A2Z59_08815 [Nitrospinae bacterium RIFCSPLOWO2_02_39_17]|nr:MAG: hypothetical protein A2Z59_08815 [Nitrospinae bacterium RIFCSPLOWO2_02_39_17]OGW11227.1 MAG: hypothetical protein A2W75_09110 [Nitrospinae bacterium RIFCSPLOWO2_12_39_15]